MKFVKTLLFTILVYTAFIIQPQLVSAQTGIMPVTMEVKNIDASGGRVTGSVNIINPNSTSFNTYLTVKIVSEDNIQVENINGISVTKMTPGSLIAYQTIPQFFLNANGQNQQNFSVNYGFQIASGNYNIQFAVFKDDGTLIGSSTTQQELNGSGIALKLNRCFIVTGETEYDPVTGPNVAPNGEVYGKCSISNVSSSDVTGFPIAEYAVNSVIGANANIAEHNTNISVTIPAGITQEVMFPLPALTTPQVYEAQAHLNDSQGNPITPKTAFRWVITGESSNIRSVTADSTEYTSGSVAKVTIGADPSLDLYWRGGRFGKDSGSPISASASAVIINPENQGTPLNDPTIVATVKDSNGTECGTAEQKVTVDPNVNIWPDQTVDVPINQDCKDIIVEAKVKNEGRELASKQIATVAKNQIAEAQRNTLWIIVTAVIGILAIAGGIFWWLKKRRSSGGKIPPAVTAVLFILTASVWLINGPINLIPSAEAALSASVKYDGFRAYTSSPCPGPGLPGQPRQSTGDGGCMAQVVSQPDMTTFNALDTSNEISMGADGKINAHISGQFTGYGCTNSVVGLIVRAYVNDSQEGVSIDGGGPKVMFDNVAGNGGGGGTAFDKNIKISSTVNKCGPLNVRIEMIPFIRHAGIVASDKNEDQLLPNNHFEGWQRVEYVDRQNCGGGGDCWATIQKQIDGGPCVQCGADCTSNNDCQYAANGCTACLPNPDGSGGRTCQTPIACGHSCASNLDCAEAINGCTSCLPDPANPTVKTCQTQPTCGSGCVTPASCEGAQNGCTSCIQGASGATCGQCPAGMNYDPNTMSCVCPVPGETNPHKVCDGDKCLTVNGCGVTTCSEDKQCFAEEMCKCDGFESVQLEYPSVNPFIFDAFAKVEGTDMTKAVVQGIKFKMYEADKSNPNAAVIIAESEMYTPELVSSTGAKARYKARWTMQPPQIKAGKTYRVLSEIKCAPKNRSTRAALPANEFQSRAVLGIATANAQEETEPTPSPSPDYLQLTTLNFIKKVETDKCYSAGFEMQEGIGSGQ